MIIALTREVSASIVRCELTHIDRQEIDLVRARAQHGAYEAVLRETGCEVHRLPEAPDFPDAVFIEDTAVVLDELAILTRPGARTRRGEIAAVAEALKPHRTCLEIISPGIMDGGDVLRMGRTIFVGRSERTNREAAEQMRRLVLAYGYRVVEVTVSGCLHLKSAVTQVAEDALVINRRWIAPEIFGDYELIDTDPSESYAANALLVNGVALYPTAFPRTGERLQKAGVKLRLVDASELAKAEGALTCCSLLIGRS